MLYAPRATLVSLLDAPRWADVLILTFVVTTPWRRALLTTDVGQLALLDRG
jgi:Ni,Fe-hydrogenase III small subunit